MSYTSGTNYRNIKSFSGGRGIVSRLKSSSVTRYSNKNTAVTSSQTASSSGTSNAALTVQLKTYSKIAQSSTQGIQKSGERLTATGDSSLFAGAEKLGSTKTVVSEATDFVNHYNNMLSSISKLGGSENKKFASQLKQYAQDNQDALKSVGITVLTDGSLTMNKNEMKEASLEDLKKVFNGEDSFADKVTNLSSDIEKNVQEKLKENLITLGASSNTASSGNYFNLFV
ncbi:hypothetical protein [Aminipila luticellarii]|uniref:Flagellar hook-associated protein 2 C-terminal domain-containing protein n=1 Tax=Aminipila luticellarii TaxID=2507160 RepID=A0A410PX33_9FIRM|nr:hypothetical protein [Aminipila luticellarii]QAT43507.1 hypothetical protein EQM06_09920 [Aminipila luticellarii]